MCQLPIPSTKKRTCCCLLAKCFSVYFSGFCSIATENLINPLSMLFSCRSIFAIPILMINWHLIWHPIPFPGNILCFLIIKKYSQIMSVSSSQKGLVYSTQESFAARVLWRPHKKEVQMGGILLAVHLRMHTESLHHICELEDVYYLWNAIGIFVQK